MSCVSLATPGTEACAAVGGAFRPQWREWPEKSVLGESHPNGILANATSSALWMLKLWTHGDRKLFAVDLLLQSYKRPLNCDTRQSGLP
jgi:hypothetical protein